jgi:acyl-coenzyme A synthetase/AMP-(fatty) acid ligase
VVRLVRQDRYASLTADERILQFAPLSFDASTFEIWGALLNGARLEVYRAGPTSLEELGAAIRDRGVTTLWLTAELFHQMVSNNVDKLMGVRQLLSGGDVLSVPHVSRAVEKLNGCRITNGYGPTEATTFSTSYEVRSGESLRGGIPIGFPIGNTRIYIAGGNEPAPIGVAGELLIGGDGLARGYLNRPEVTAEKFVPDLYGTELGVRLYRTGDLARRREHGEIEYVGRGDAQIKIRGYRVELGEIESALAGHAGVLAAVVTAQKGAAGEKQLVAHVVCNQAGTTAADLRGFLKAKLPAYMLPSAIVFIDRMPQTRNGKIDRRALPHPDGCNDGSNYLAPRNPTEEIVAGIWASVLGLEQVGVNDDFLAAGGHSLKVQRPVRDQVERPSANPRAGFRH